MPVVNREHAVVVGASIGGLMAASALSRHFRRVTLVERDSLPKVGDQRRGVPQGKHAHGLLAGGLRVFERYFPELPGRLIAAGGIPGDVSSTGRWFQEGGYMNSSSSGIEGVLISRPMVEGLLREQLLALPNVSVMTGVQVTGFAAAEGRITGVRLQPESGGPATLDAQLTIDAAGRQSHCSQWLEELGFPQPAVKRVEVSIAYTTRQFRRRREHLGGSNFAIIAAHPEGKRGGVILAQEQDRWIVTLFGYFGQCAPSDLAGFIEFARSLPSPDIYHAIKDAEPLGEPQEARFPASIRRQFESLTRFPAGFLAFGDAICSFNPIYGQGMTVSAQEAVALDEALAAGDEGLASRFYAAAAKVVDNPWGIAVGSDLRVPEAKGDRTVAVRAINWYIAKLLRASHHDATLAAAFHRVSNLLAPPASLLSPGIALRVLAASLGGARKTAGAQATAGPSLAQ